MKTELMVDVETLGTKPGCVVLSVGVAEFDRYGDGVIWAGGYTINAKDSVKHGLTLDVDTVLWWCDDKPEALAASQRGALEFGDVFERLDSLIQDKEPDTIWCQGVDFDLPILRAAFEAAGFDGVPWKYNVGRDTRTLYDIAGFDPKSIERAGIYHNAVDDSVHQVKCVQAAFRKLAER